MFIASDPVFSRLEVFKTFFKVPFTSLFNLKFFLLQNVSRIKTNEAK